MGQRKINCNQCSNRICNADENQHIGFQVQNAGGIYKIPILFNGSSEPLYFCTQECYKTYYEENVPKKPEVSAALAELKKDIPAMAKETAKHIGKFHKNLLNLQNKNRKNGN